MMTNWSADLVSDEHGCNDVRLSYCRRIIHELNELEDTR